MIAAQSLAEEIGQLLLLCERHLEIIETRGHRDRDVAKLWLRWELERALDLAFPEYER